MIRHCITIIALVTWLSSALAERAVFASSGTLGSQYNLAVGAVCRLINEEHISINCFTLPSEGAEHNLERLSLGSAQLGIVPANLYYDNREKYPDIQPLVGLFQETATIIVRSESLINNIYNLKQHIVNLGEENSAIWLMAKKILAAANLFLSDLSTVTLLDPHQPSTAQALCQGQTDAVFFMESLPSETLQHFLAHCDVRLLGLPIEPSKKLTTTNPELETTVISVDSSKSSKLLSSVATTALLVGHKNSLSEEQGYLITKLLVTKLKQLKKRSSIFKRTHLNTLISPTRYSWIHSGAKRYFKSNDLL